MCVGGRGGGGRGRDSTGAEKHHLNFSWVDIRLTNVFFQHLCIITDDISTHKKTKGYNMSSNSKTLDYIRILAHINNNSISIKKYILTVNVREITPLKTKRGFPIKTFRSGLHVLIPIILLHCFDVCISIVSLNRYVIQIILLHGFDVCISIVRLNRYVIQIILLHGFDVGISIVRLNR